jgi:hypothetical protein
MATVEAPFYTRTSIERLTAQDFETASIRSAAPSYGKSHIPRIRREGHEHP